MFYQFEGSEQKDADQTVHVCGLVCVVFSRYQVAIMIPQDNGHLLSSQCQHCYTYASQCVAIMLLNLFVMLYNSEIKIGKDACILKYMQMI